MWLRINFDCAATLCDRKWKAPQGGDRRRKHQKANDDFEKYFAEVEREGNGAVVAGLSFGLMRRRGA